MNFLSVRCSIRINDQWRICLDGQRAITGDTALRLGHFLGTTAEFWLNLQKLHELRIAERKSGKAVEALPRLADDRRRPHAT